MDSKRLASANKRGGSAEYCPMSGSCRQTSKRRNNTLGNFWLVADEVEGKGKMREKIFITNNLEWSAFTTCQLYQFHLGVEVFFKETKQTIQLSDYLATMKTPCAGRYELCTGLPAAVPRGMEQQMEASFQQTLHACTCRSVEFLPAGKPH